MLVININVNLKHSVADIKIVRGEKHPKLPNHFYYSFVAKDDMNSTYVGEVLHNYGNGAYALTNRVLKAILLQQKVARSKR